MTYRNGAIAPIVIQVMMHVYTRAAPFEPYLPQSIARNQSLGLLLNEGLIKKDSECMNGYRSTQKGDDWVRILCVIPFETSVAIHPRCLPGMRCTVCNPDD